MGQVRWPSPGAGKRGGLVIADCAIALPSGSWSGSHMSARDSNPRRRPETRLPARRVRLVIVVSVIAGLVAAGAAAWLAQRKHVPPISADDPRQVALGASV